MTGSVVTIFVWVVVPLWFSIRLGFILLGLQVWPEGSLVGSWFQDGNLRGLRGSQVGVVSSTQLVKGSVSSFVSSLPPFRPQIAAVLQGLTIWLGVAKPVLLGWVY